MNLEENQAFVNKFLVDNVTETKGNCSKFYFAKIKKKK